MPQGAIFHTRFLCAAVQGALIVQPAPTTMVQHRSFAVGSLSSWNKLSNNHELLTVLSRPLYTSSRRPVSSNVVSGEPLMSMTLYKSTITMKILRLEVVVRYLSTCEQRVEFG